MHLRSTFIAAGVALATALALAMVGRPAYSHGDAKPSRAPSPQPVLVELFTSEGCSSCPPADSLLKELSEEQSIDGAEVIALEEHVDYWNRLGWNDPFSSPDFTRRQEDYATTLPDGGVYTPQMIVDGRVQFVSSRSNEARETIRSAALRPKSRLLLTSITPSEPHSRPFDLRLDPATPLSNSHLDLWLAVTEKKLQSHVSAGENSGQTLEHAPVVRLLRRLQVVPSPFVGPLQVNVDLRPDWKPANLTAIAFFADRRTHQIVAAGVASLSP